MVFPFVSRRAYEDAMRRVSELEEERKLLLDRLLDKPLFHKPALSPASSFSTTNEDEKEEVAPPRPSRPTLAGIRMKANDFAAAKARKDSPNLKVGA